MRKSEDEFEAALRLALKPFTDEMGDHKINNLWYSSGSNPIGQIMGAASAYGDQREAEGRRDVFAEYRAYKSSFCDRCKGDMIIVTGVQDVWTEYCPRCDRSKPVEANKEVSNG